MADQLDPNNSSRTPVPGQQPAGSSSSGIPVPPPPSVPAPTPVNVPAPDVPIPPTPPPVLQPVVQPTVPDSQKSTEKPAVGPLIPDEIAAELQAFSTSRVGPAPMQATEPELPPVSTSEPTPKPEPKATPAVSIPEPKSEPEPESVKEPVKPELVEPTAVAPEVLPEPEIKPASEPKPAPKIEEAQTPVQVPEPVAQKAVAEAKTPPAATPPPVDTPPPAVTPVAAPPTAQPAPVTPPSAAPPTMPLATPQLSATGPAQVPPATAPVAAPPTAQPAPAPQQAAATSPPATQPVQPVAAVPAAQPAPAPQQPSQSGMQPLLPFVLLVLDGWGVAPPSRGNAISIANTPNMDRLMNQYPTVTLHASGEVVGLPWAEMGNSEVGHLNVGSGKIIYQQLPMINKAISEGTFFTNQVIIDAIAKVKESGSKLHLMGLVSDGGIHSSQDHLFALLEMCQKQGLEKNVFIHAIVDGRDTEKNAALGFIARLETKMQETGVGRIATLAGRHFTMDRDNRWDRIEKSFNMMRWGKSESVSDSPLKAIEESYSKNIFDEQFAPTVLQQDGKPIATIDDGDVVIFFNFRADRARQITKAFTLPGFAKFDRGAAPENLSFICMTEYEKNLPVKVAFQPDTVKEPVSKVVAEAGWNQLRIAETEKYAHVTFFFNGGQEVEFENEERVLIPSPRVASYDKTPAMSVHLIAERIVKELQEGSFQFVVANFANADMVGHTGNLQAAIKAVEEADKAVGTVANALLGMNGTIVITSDHGNAEEMVDLQTGEIIKEHSTNAVPCIIANSTLMAQRMMWPPVPDGDLSRMQPVGVLSDVAPTVLTLMGLPVPDDMTSRSLIH